MEEGGGKEDGEDRGRTTHTLKSRWQDKLRGHDEIMGRDSLLVSWKVQWADRCSQSVARVHWSGEPRRGSYL